MTAHEAFNEAHEAFDDALDALIERDELTSIDKHVAGMYVTNALDALCRHWGAEVVAVHVRAWLDQEG